jgi:hypothetical protein
MHIRLEQGDSLQILKYVQDNSIDSCICDPPYGIKFLNKKWDHDVPSVELWKEVFRVLKPGAHLLSFFGTRTYHRGVTNLEDAGFEIRDQIGWCFGSGFPKSLNLEGELEGWGTALKPAWEPIVLARKPFKGSVSNNMLEHKTGALNIDGCRIEGEPWKSHKATGLGTVKFFTEGETKVINKSPHELGRWPANFIHNGDEEVVELLGDASRFFYCAKASVSEKEEGLNELKGSTLNRVNPGGIENDPRWAPVKRKNNHPTVKPVKLMSYLCRLITPPGGTVLDPFMGSGSTGVGAVKEGFNFVGIELDPHFLLIAKKRIEHHNGKKE